MHNISPKATRPEVDIYDDARYKIFVAPAEVDGFPMSLRRIGIKDESDIEVAAGSVLVLRGRDIKIPTLRVDISERRRGIGTQLFRKLIKEGSEITECEEHDRNISLTFGDDSIFCSSPVVLPGFMSGISERDIHYEVHPITKYNPVTYSFRDMYEVKIYNSEELISDILESEN